MRQNSSSTTGDSGGRTISTFGVAFSLSATALASFTPRRCDKLAIARRDRLLFIRLTSGLWLAVGLNSLIEMAGWYFEEGMGGAE